mgnify:CR=1 FL=1
MKMYIKQKVFSLKDKFNIMDEHGNNLYSVQGKVFSMGKRLYIFDSNSKEVAFLKQKLWSLLPRFEVYIKGKKGAEVIRRFSFLTPKYLVEGPNWNINGDFWAHNYEVSQNEEIIVKVNKKLFSWGDSYELDIKESNNEILALCTVLAIDADIAIHSD